MKQFTTLVLSFFLLSGAINAQNFNVGIKGGVNAYNISDDFAFGNDTKIGFHLGLIGHAHLSKQIALQPEIVFSTQGSKNTDLNYVNIPLMFQYMHDNGFRWQAGPQLGFLVGAKTNNINITNDCELIDFGIGIGLSYVNPATDFGFDLRYNHGLSNIFKNDNTVFFNRGFQLGCFYLFNHE
jgi:hypothetical protein